MEAAIPAASALPLTPAARALPLTPAASGLPATIDLQDPSSTQSTYNNEIANELGATAGTLTSSLRRFTSDRPMSMPTFDLQLREVIRSRLNERLPGRAAQRLYSHELSYGRHFGPHFDNARQAAVLVLMRWDGDQWLLPLTRRQAGGIHSRQICFAGGGIDPGESVIEAAMRECREETGWCPKKDDILGTLSPIYVYASNNFVSCVVAATTQTPNWDPDEREVEELIEVPLQHVCTDSTGHLTTLHRHGQTTKAKCFRWQSYDIWGATSMMISELKSVIMS